MVVFINFISCLLKIFLLIGLCNATPVFRYRYSHKSNKSTVANIGKGSFHLFGRRGNNQVVTKSLVGFDTNGTSTNVSIESNETSGNDTSNTLVKLDEDEIEADGESNVATKLSEAVQEAVSSFCLFNLEGDEKHLSKFCPGPSERTLLKLSLPAPNLRTLLALENNAATNWKFFITGISESIPKLSYAAQDVLQVGRDLIQKNSAVYMEDIQYLLEYNAFIQEKMTMLRDIEATLRIKVLPLISKLNPNSTDRLDEFFTLWQGKEYPDDMYVDEAVAYASKDVNVIKGADRLDVFLEYYRSSIIGSLQQRIHKNLVAWNSLTMDGATTTCKLSEIESCIHAQLDIFWMQMEREIVNQVVRLAPVEMLKAIKLPANIQFNSLFNIEVVSILYNSRFAIDLKSVYRSFALQLGLRDRPLLKQIENVVIRDAKATMYHPSMLKSKVFQVGKLLTQDVPAQLEHNYIVKALNDHFQKYYNIDNVGSSVVAFGDLLSLSNVKELEHTYFDLVDYYKDRQFVVPDSELKEPAQVPDGDALWDDVMQQFFE